MRALLTVIGGLGNDTLYVDDQAQSGDSNATLTGSTLTGLNMPSVSEVQTIRVQASSGVYTLRIADDSVNATKPTSTVLTLGGTPIDGDSWTVVIAGQYRYTTTVDASKGAVSLADVAAALAQLINGSNGFSAGSDGDMLAIANGAGLGFQVSFEIVTKARAPSAAVTQVQGASASMLLSGAVVAGDHWNFFVSGTQYSLLVGSNDKLADLAKRVADAINADKSVFDYLAIAVGNTVLVVDRAANSHVPSLALSIALNGGGTGSSATRERSTAETLLLGGTPVAGEQWFVTIKGTSYGFVVQDPLQDVLLGLRDAINAASGLGYSASVDSSGLVISVGSGSFTATLGRSGSGSPVVSGLSGNQTLSLAVGTAPLQGEVWTLNLTRTDAKGQPLTGAAGQPNYLSVTVDSLSKIAAGIAAAIEASGSTDVAASAEGRSLILVDRHGNLGLDTLAVQVRSMASADISSLTAPVGMTRYTFSGPLIAGEKWQLTLTTAKSEVFDLTYTVRAGDTWTKVAAGLKAAFDAAAARNSVPSGISLQQVQASADVLLGGASAKWTMLPAGRASNSNQSVSVSLFALAGTPVNGDRWVVNVNGTAVAVSVKNSPTLAEVGTALADQMNLGLGANLHAFFVGDTLFVIDRSGATIQASAQIELPGITAGSMQVQASDIRLGGTAAVGEVWIVNLQQDVTDSEVQIFSYTVAAKSGGAPTTTDEIAAALTQRINTESAGVYVAQVSGSIISVVRSDSAALKAKVLLVPAVRTAGAITVPGQTDQGPSERVIEVNVDTTKAPALTGAVWTLNLSVGNQVFAFNQAVQTGESALSIAQGWATLINQEALTGNTAMAGVLATATKTGTLLIGDIGARSLKVRLSLVQVANAAIDGTTTTTHVSLVGTAQALQSWSLQLAGHIFKVTYGDSVNGRTVQSLADVAAALAYKVNTDGASLYSDISDANVVLTSRYVALAEGANVYLVDRQAGIFDTTLQSGNITHSAGHADIVLSYTLNAADLQRNLVELYGYGKDDIRVDEARANGNVTYTVSFVNAQAGIDQAQIRWAETASNSGLLPSPDASVDVSIATLKNGARVNVGINNLQTVTINPNVTSGTFTLAFDLPDGHGTTQRVQTGAVAFNGTAVDLYKAVSLVLNPNGSTVDIDAAFDAVSRSPSKPYTDNVAVIKVGNTFQITFQGVYRNLTIADIDTRGLNTQALGSTTAQQQAIVASVTLGATQGVFEMEARNPRATLVNLDQLTATPLVVGEVWQIEISLRGVTSLHAVTIGASSTLDDVARLLADSVNASASDNFSATHTGAVLVIVNRDGTAFKVSLQVGLNDVGSSKTIDRSTAYELAVRLAGTAKAGEVWSLVLTDSETLLPSQPMLYTVQATDTVDSIAAALAVLVNAQVGDQYTALSEGGRLVIVRRDGTEFGATPLIASADQPVAGQKWNISLHSATSGTTIAKAVGGILVLSYEVKLGDTAANVARALSDLINAQGMPEFRASSLGEVLTIENIAGNVFDTVFTVDGVDRTPKIEAAAAQVAVRTEGINYYELDTLNLNLGRGDDVVNVQGTSANTNLSLGAGNDRIYVSSTAAFGLNTSVNPGPTDFLSGHLHNINGGLNVDAGTGRNLLLIGGEASTLDNNDIVISDVPVAGEPTNAEIAVRGLTGGIAAFGWADLAQGTITYRADSTGNFADGMRLWTGFGADTIHIDGTLYRAGERTITLLNTGLGDDTVYVNLQTTEANGSDTTDGLLVLNTQGPWNDYANISDNDTVIATGADAVFGGAFSSFSTSVPLVVFGGQGNDKITGGSGNDILFGDRGRVLSYGLVNGATVASVVEQLGSGGAGDLIDGVLRNPDRIVSVDPGIGGDDTLIGLEGDNILIGGFGNDELSTGSGNDTILGDNGQVDFWAGTTHINTVQSTDVVAQTGGNDTIVTGDGVNFVIAGMGADHVNDPAVLFSATVVAGSGSDTVLGDNGTYTLDNTGAMSVIESTLPNLGGDDVVWTGNANSVVIGGFGNDTITTGLGADVVLGDDGRIDTALDGNTADIDLITSTSTTAFGGADTIDSGAGNDIVIGGRMDDTILAGEGDNIVIGDSGSITAASVDAPQRAGLPITVGVIETTTFADGGGDTITTGDGNNIVMGGFGNDTITTGLGADIVMGDDARIDTMLDGNPADIDLIASTSTTAFGGADTINSGAGNDIVIGGRGADTVIAGEGDNIVIGDSGSITAANVDAPQRAGLPITVGVIETTTFADGGGDTITTGDGNNIVMGGFGNDTITTGLGADIVMGDDARIDTMLDGNPADIDLIASTSTTAFGGADTINSGAGNDIVIGGRGADTVIAGEGDNIVIGDSGSITAASVDAPQRAALPITVGVIETIAYAEGGNDTITTGDGNNIVMGGFGNDTITTGLGADIVMGDDARIDTMLDGNPADIDLIISTSTTAYGGADTINSGAGNDIVIGGRGDDSINAGDGNNIVIGDSGSITAATTDSPQLAGLPITIATVQAIAVADGGNDSITTGAGNDLVIAGFGNDVVSTGDGNDVVLGDSGVIVVDALGALVSIATGDPVLGGNDVIDTGAGNDVAMGGAGNDTVLGGAGNDILFGDGGQVTYSPDGRTVDILSLDTTLGGSDIVDGGLGNDVLIGGQGVDNIYGTLSSDLIFGNNAAVRLLSGLVVRMEADVHDLVTATMFGMFDALPDRLEVAAVAFQDLWLVFPLGEDGKVVLLQGDDLLDITVFENIFALSIHGRSQGIEGSDVFQNLFQLGSAVVPAEQQHSGSMEPQEGDAPASVPVTPQPVEQAVPATSYQQETAPTLLQSAGQGTDSQRNVQSDVLATLLGITGLQLNDGQRRRCRTLLRVAARKWHALLRRGWV